MGVAATTVGSRSAVRGRALMRILAWMVCIGAAPLLGCGKAPRPPRPPSPRALVAPPPLTRVAPIIKTVIRNKGSGNVTVEVINVVAEGSTVAAVP
jgi:hypothetical protein